MAYIHFIGLIQGPEHSRHLCHFIYTGDCAHICVNGDAWIYPKGDLERAKYICIKLAVFYTYYIGLTNVYVQCILYNVNYTFIKEGIPVMRKVVSPKERATLKVCSKISRYQGFKVAKVLWKVNAHLKIFGSNRLCFIRNICFWFKFLTVHDFRNETCIYTSQIVLNIYYLYSGQHHWSCPRSVTLSRFVARY